MSANRPKTSGKPSTPKSKARPSRTRPAPKPKPVPASDAYPALSQFLSGYLHQDFVLDYETPAGALAAFLKDASASERRALRQEWGRFAAATARAAWPELCRAFGSLGGAWTPPSHSALSAAFTELGGTKPGRR